MTNTATRITIDTPLINKATTARYRAICEKMTGLAYALEIAKVGLRSANKKNPFWSKSQAFKYLNQIRKAQKQASKIYALELSLMDKQALSRDLNELSF